MTNERSVKVTPFDPAAYLTDEASISEYLNACLELGDPAALLNAIGDVARAKGMTELARKAGLGRESLYKALTPGAHPRYDTVFKVTQALGVTLRFSAAEPAKKTAVRKAAAKRAAPAKRVRAPHTEARALAKSEADSPKKHTKRI